MLEFVSELGLFAAKAIIIVTAIIMVIGAVASARAARKSPSGTVQVTNISDSLTKQHSRLMAHLLDKKAYKLWQKQQKKKAKTKRSTHSKKQKTQKSQQAATSEPKVFVLDFVGDIKASQAKKLSREITAIVQVAGNRDEVVLRLESAGGMVHGYGLASSQLYRLQEHKIKLTVSIDKVAASGGYMMASMASKIIAAPFAIVGSIGVVAQIPNFNKLLKNWNIDFEQHTSGKYKRTLTMFSENTQEGRKKFRQELDNTHALFKNMIQTHRSGINISKVATGETWYGQEAVALKLVDQITTSDEYLYRLSRHKPVYHMEYKEKKHIADRLALAISAVCEHLLMRWAGKDYQQRQGQ